MVNKLIAAAAAVCMLAFPEISAADSCAELDRFRAAAARGNAEAIGVVGNAYYHGVCVEQDYMEALRLYHKAAEKGNALAQADLGLMYMTGQGAEQNYRTAFKWFHEAAENGLADAQVIVGRMYFKGIGVDQNFETGLSWFTKACSKGVFDACRIVARSMFSDKVVTSAGPLKQQVELCYCDLGALKDAQPNPDTGATSCSSNAGIRSQGNGWNLRRAVEDTDSGYIRSAVIKDGVIKLVSKGISLGGKDSFTLILVPYPDASRANDWGINWKISPKSTCLAAGLC